MKQLKIVSRLKIQRRITEEEKTQKCRERKSIWWNSANEYGWSLYSWHSSLSYYRRWLTERDYSWSCLQWSYRSNVLKVKTWKYYQEILVKENQGYIWKNLMCNLERFQRCHQWKTRMDMQNLWQIFKKQIPPRSQANNLELDPIVDLFLDQAGKELYPIALMQISQIIPFMFKTAKHTSERWWLKGHCVLVSAYLKKGTDFIV